VSAARCASVHLADDIIGSAGLARLLDTSTRTARRMRNQRPKLQLMEAVARQLRARWYGRSGGDPQNGVGIPLGAPPTGD
jgi:hypothetical protein